MTQDNAKQIEAFRAAAHRQLDQWVDLQTEMLTSQKMPTLRQISDQFTQTRSLLLGGVTSRDKSGRTYHPF